MSYEHCDTHDRDATNGCEGCLADEVYQAVSHLAKQLNVCDERAWQAVRFVLFESGLSMPIRLRGTGIDDKLDLAGLQKLLLPVAEAGAGDGVGDNDALQALRNRVYALERTVFGPAVSVPTKGSERSAGISPNDTLEPAQCEWVRCVRRAVTARTDLGGSSYHLCVEHVKEGERRGYWRP